MKTCRARLCVPNLCLPTHGINARIGLFGGSFNPPHDGHLLVSLIALRRLDLQQVWWLVTPGNPLKSNHTLPQTSYRLAQAKNYAAHPRLKAIDLETAIGSSYTAKTICYLTTHYPKLHFVWIMGADNLCHFHHWHHWRSIVKRVPIIIIDRPGSSHKALRSPAAIFLSRYRCRESQAKYFALRRAPAFIFLHDRRSTQSSTRLRHENSLEQFSFK